MDRFVEDAIHAQSFVFLVHGGSQFGTDDHDLSRVVQFPELPDESKSIEVRHVMVGNDEIEPGIHRDAIEREASILDTLHAVSVAFQQNLHDVTQLGDVVSVKYPEKPILCGSGVGGWGEQGGHVVGISFRDCSDQKMFSPCLAKKESIARRVASVSFCLKRHKLHRRNVPLSPTPVASAPSTLTAAPTTFGGVLRQLGPGLIITASIVGSGELIVTPKLGASAGFTLLWFIVIGCVLKVFIQIELGRFTLARGLTTLETMNLVPGPRFVVSWLLWLWLIMFAATVLQVAGMLGGLASILTLAGVNVSKPLIAIVIGALTALLLVVGRYRLIETASTWMVVAFTLCTMTAVVALQFTPFAITPMNLVEGFSFRLPADFTVAFAAFGIIGVGASELIYYPYWCLEKGYARHVGRSDGSATWEQRARGWMRVLNADAWMSCLIYTCATLAFYLLGAAVLHAKGLDVTNADMISTLSHMYQETFGQWSLWLFFIGAFAVLYSTVFVATASNARLLADALAVFRVKTFTDEADRQRTVRWLCGLVPVAWTILYLVWGSPVTLVFVGAVAQGLMIPFLALAALWLNYRQTDPALRTGLLWRMWLWLAAICMTAVGVYQVVTELGRWVR